MATKKYIIKQSTNWNARGEKVGTSTVQMDEADISSYIALLDGKVEVYELNSALSVDAPTATVSLDIVDFVKIRHNVLKPLYISNGNKRPIIFKSPVQTVITTLGAMKPFEAPYSADLPMDVSVDTGNMSLL
jgi:hypothetical protein